MRKNDKWLRETVWQFEKDSSNVHYREVVNSMLLFTTALKNNGKKIGEDDKPTASIITPYVYFRGLQLDKAETMEAAKQVGSLVINLLYNGRASNHPCTSSLYFLRADSYR